MRLPKVFIPNSHAPQEPRFPAVLNDKPWLSLFLLFLVSLDLAVYGTFVDGATRLIADDSLGTIRDQMGPAVLKLILPPILTILTLVLLPPT